MSSRHFHTRQFLVNAVILAFLYWNAEGMRSSWRLLGDRSALPNTQYTHNLFYMFGVFRQVTTLSRRWVAFGSAQPLREEPSSPRDDMIDLHLASYFPQSQGEAKYRMGLWGYRNDRHRRTRAFVDMANRVKRLHNVDNVAQRVADACIYSYTWPADPRGYDHNFNQRVVELHGCSD